MIEKDPNKKTIFIEVYEDEFDPGLLAVFNTLVQERAEGIEALSKKAGDQEVDLLDIKSGLLAEVILEKAEALWGSKRTWEVQQANLPEGFVYPDDDVSHEP